MSERDNRREHGDMTERYEVSVVEAQSRAEIDTQIATAKHYPRSVQKSYANALSVVESSREVAEACFYTLPRSGQKLFGPSVRLAEIMVTNWGNLRVKTTIVDEGSDCVICQSSAIDLETNVGVSVEVRRRIKDKNGRRFNDDMITTTTNAASAIAFRNAVFKVIPAVFVQPIFERAMQIAVGKETEIDQRRTKCVKYFASLGVPAPVLMKHLGRSKAVDITLADIEYLLGIQNALKEQESTIDEIFSVTRDGKPMTTDGKPDDSEKPTTLEGVAAKAKQQTKAKTTPKPEPKTDPEPDENGEIPNTGEGQSDTPDPEFSYDEDDAPFETQAELI